MKPLYFPTKRISAAALIKNAWGDLLVVKPSYRDGWLLPGGVIEKNESPAAGVLREIQEELGLSCRIQNLLCVDHVERSDMYGESIHFLFKCACSESVFSDPLETDDREILAARFMPFEEALTHLVPSIAARLRTCNDSFDGSALYLERGIAPAW